MASHKLAEAAASLDEEELEMDMSSMIDLVFLLLIFFMVSSHLIILKIDRRVEPPTAKNAIVAKNATGRIMINVLADGSVWDANKNELPDTDAITAHITNFKQMAVSEGGLQEDEIRLNLRADRNVETRDIKRVVEAAGEAGVTDVIFGSYVVER